MSFWKRFCGSYKEKDIDLYNRIIFNAELKKYYPNVFFEGKCAIQNPGLYLLKKM